MGAKGLSARLAGRTFRFVLVSTLCAFLAYAADAAPQKPIKVAVITHAGGAHLTIYYSVLAALEEIESVALCDLDGASVEDARKRLGAKLGKVYTNRDEMFSSESPGMVLVSMEAKLAPDAIDAALDRGCHVLAEKPACVNAEDFARLVAKAKSKNLHLMLALANRVNPEVFEAKRAIADGKLGKIFGLEMNLIQDQTRLTSSGYHASWQADKARAGGGHLTWLGIHWLDLAMYITGSKIDEVAGFAGNVGGQPISIEDSVAMSMRFDNGTFGTLTSGYYLDKGSQTHLKIWGSKGWLQIDSGEPQTMTMYSTADGTEGKSSVFTRPDGFDPYVVFLRSAVCASAGLEAPPITGDESLRVLKAVYRTYDAAANNKSTKVE
jgi:predicted dehydrogenase